MKTEVIGIDHIYLAVTDLGISEKFYDKIMPILGFKKTHNPIGGEPHIHYFCKYYGFTLRPAKSRIKHDPYSPGLHHFCFRVESKEEIEEIFREFKRQDITVSDPKLYSEYSPDYFAIFFDDPDGIRLEITNYRNQRKRHLNDWDNVT